MYTDVFWDLKVYVFLRSSLAHTSYMYMIPPPRYIWGLHPPPPPPIPKSWLRYWRHVYLTVFLSNLQCNYSAINFVFSRNKPKINAYDSNPLFFLASCVAIDLPTCKDTLQYNSTIFPNGFTEDATDAESKINQVVWLSSVGRNHCLLASENTNEIHSNTHSHSFSFKHPFAFLLFYTIITSCIVFHRTLKKAVLFLNDFEREISLIINACVNDQDPKRYICCLQKKWNIILSHSQ